MLRSYCDPQLISEVIVPLLSVATSSLLCISTLLEGHNHYSRMFDLTTASGKKVFETIQLSLVCDECAKTDHPERCTHKQHLLPRWLSSTKMETVRAMLSDDPAMLLRESMGYCADSTTKAFSSSDVEHFLARSVAPEIDQEAVIVISCDPSGGGASAFAVCSLVQLPTGQLVVGCCSSQWRKRSSKSSARAATRHTNRAGACAMPCT